jgi:hypothetical protein
MTDNVLNEMMGDDLFSECNEHCSECSEHFTDKELGINEKDYLDKNGHYKDKTGNEYNCDRNYLTFKKFYEYFVSKMEPTKEDFYILKNNYNNNKDYDYSFVKSPSLKYLLFDEPLPTTNVSLHSTKKDDPYFHLLDIEIREIMNDLIMLLKTSEDYNFKKNIVEKIKQIKKTDYIFTDKENSEIIIPLLIYSKKH